MDMGSERGQSKHPHQVYEAAGDAGLWAYKHAGADSLSQ